MSRRQESEAFHGRSNALRGMNLRQVTTWIEGAGNLTGEENSHEADERLHLLRSDARNRGGGELVPEVRTASSPGGSLVPRHRRQGAQFTGNWTSGEGVMFPSVLLKFDFVGLRYDASLWSMNFLIGNFMGTYPVAHAVKNIMGYSRVGDALRRVRAIENTIRIRFNWSRLSFNDEGWFKMGQVVGGLLMTVPGLYLGRWEQPRTFQQARNTLMFWLDAALRFYGESGAPVRTAELTERDDQDEQVLVEEEDRLTSEENENEDDASSEGDSEDGEFEGPFRLRDGASDSAAESDFSPPESSGSEEQATSEISGDGSEESRERGEGEAGEGPAEGVQRVVPPLAVRSDEEDEEVSDEAEDEDSEPGPYAWMAGAEGQLAERTPGLERLRGRLRRGVARYRREGRLGLTAGPVVRAGEGRFDRYRVRGLHGWELRSSFDHPRRDRVRPLRTEFHGDGLGYVHGWRVEDGGPFRRRGQLNLLGYAIRWERAQQALRNAESVRREAERQAVGVGRVVGAEAADAGESGPSQPRSSP